MSIDPIRIGFLRDYVRPGVTPGPDAYPDIDRCFQLVADEFLEAGLLDRPVEFVLRHVSGLPKGSFKAVRDAFYELVDEGCVAIFGPWISENGVPLRKHVEELAEVPIIAMCATESMLGEWVFALPNGSMEEEPIIMAKVAGYDGHRRIGLLYEDSLIGEEYLRAARAACRDAGLSIITEVAVPQVETDKVAAMRELKAANPDAIMHVGFGLGLVGTNDALREIGWDPPRYTTTAFLLGAPEGPFRQHVAGWTGVDQYDERNEIGEAFIQRFEARYGYRIDNFWPTYCYDMARLILTAVAGARPLTGQGVKEGLERIKMMPAACGAPGTRLRFGKFIRQGFFGSGFLVMRRASADGSKISIHATIEGLVGPA